MNFVLEKEKKTIGEILGESVHDSMITILIIGGFIIIFSVLCQILTTLNIIIFFSNLLVKIIPFSVDPNIIYGSFFGIIEMTNGVNVASQTFSRLGVSIVCGIITFGGFSIHAQSISFISKTDIKVSTYLLAKFFGAVLSILLAFMLFPFFSFNKITPVFKTNLANIMEVISFSFELYILAFFALAVLALIIFFIGKPNIFTKK